MALLQLVSWGGGVRAALCLLWAKGLWRLMADSAWQVLGCAGLLMLKAMGLCLLTCPEQTCEKHPALLLSCCQLTRV